MFNVFVKIKNFFLNNNFYRLDSNLIKKNFNKKDFFLLNLQKSHFLNKKLKFVNLIKKNLFKKNESTDYNFLFKKLKVKKKKFLGKKRIFFSENIFSLKNKIKRSRLIEFNNFVYKRMLNCDDILFGPYLDTSFTEINYDYVRIYNFDRKKIRETKSIINEKYSFFLFDGYYNIFNNLNLLDNFKERHLDNSQWNFKSFDVRSLCVKYNFEFNIGSNKFKINLFKLLILNFLKIFLKFFYFILLLLIIFVFGLFFLDYFLIKIVFNYNDFFYFLQIYSQWFFFNDFFYILKNSRLFDYNTNIFFLNIFNYNVNNLYELFENGFLPLKLWVKLNINIFNFTQSFKLVYYNNEENYIYNFIEFIFLKINQSKINFDFFNSFFIFNFLNFNNMHCCINDINNFLLKVLSFNNNFLINFFTFSFDKTFLVIYFLALKNFIFEYLNFEFFFKKTGFFFVFEFIYLVSKNIYNVFMDLFLNKSFEFIYNQFYEFFYNLFIFYEKKQVYIVFYNLFIFCKCIYEFFHELFICGKNMYWFNFFFERKFNENLFIFDEIILTNKNLLTDFYSIKINENLFLIDFFFIRELIFYSIFYFVDHTTNVINFDLEKFNFLINKIYVYLDFYFFDYFFIDFLQKFFYFSSIFIDYYYSNKFFVNNLLNSFFLFLNFIKINLIDILSLYGFINYKFFNLNVNDFMFNFEFNKNFQKYFLLNSKFPLLFYNNDFFNFDFFSIFNYIYRNDRYNLIEEFNYYYKNVKNYKINFLVGLNYLDYLINLNLLNKDFRIYSIFNYNYNNDYFFGSLTFLNFFDTSFINFNYFENIKFEHGDNYIAYLISYIGNSLVYCYFYIISFDSKYSLSGVLSLMFFMNIFKMEDILIILFIIFIQLLLIFLVIYSIFLSKDIWRNIFFFLYPKDLDYLLRYSSFVEEKNHFKREEEEDFHKITRKISFDENLQDYQKYIDEEYNLSNFFQFKNFLKKKFLNFNFMLDKRFFDMASDDGAAILDSETVKLVSKRKHKKMMEKEGKEQLFEEEETDDIEMEAETELTVELGLDSESNYIRNLVQAELEVEGSELDEMRYSNPELYLDERLSPLDIDNIYVDLSNSYFNNSYFPNMSDFFFAIPNNREYSTFSANKFTKLDINIILMFCKAFTKRKLKKKKYFHFFFKYFSFFHYNFNRFFYVSFHFYIMYVFIFYLFFIYFNEMLFFLFLRYNLFVFIYLFLFTFFFLFLRYIFKNKNFLNILFKNKIFYLFIFLNISLLNSKYFPLNLNKYHHLENFYLNDKFYFYLNKNKIYHSNKNFLNGGIYLNLKENILKFSNLSLFSLNNFDRIFLINIINNFFYSKYLKINYLRLFDFDYYLNNELIYYGLFKHYMSSYKDVYSFYTMDNAILHKKNNIGFLLEKNGFDLNFQKLWWLKSFFFEKFTSFLLLNSKKRLNNKEKKLFVFGNRYSKKTLIPFFLNSSELFNYFQFMCIKEDCNSYKFNILNVYSNISNLTFNDGLKKIFLDSKKLLNNIFKINYNNFLDVLLNKENNFLKSYFSSLNNIKNYSDVYLETSELTDNFLKEREFCDFSPSNIFCLSDDNDSYPTTSIISDLDFKKKNLKYDTKFLSDFFNLKNKNSRLRNYRERKKNKIFDNDDPFVNDSNNFTKHYSGYSFKNVLINSFFKRKFKNIYRNEYFIGHRKKFRTLNRNFKLTKFFMKNGKFSGFIKKLNRNNLFNIKIFSPEKGVKGYKDDNKFDFLSNFVITSEFNLKDYFYKLNYLDLFKKNKTIDLNIDNFTYKDFNFWYKKSIDFRKIFLNNNFNFFEFFDIDFYRNSFFEKRFLFKNSEDNILFYKKELNYKNNVFDLIKKITNSEIKISNVNDINFLNKFIMDSDDKEVLLEYIELLKLNFLKIEKEDFNNDNNDNDDNDDNDDSNIVNLVEEEEYDSIKMDGGPVENKTNKIIEFDDYFDGLVEEKYQSDDFKDGRFICEEDLVRPEFIKDYTRKFLFNLRKLRFHISDDNLIRKFLILETINNLSLILKDRFQEQYWDTDYYDRLNNFELDIKDRKNFIEEFVKNFPKDLNYFELKDIISSIEQPCNIDNINNINNIDKSIWKYNEKEVEEKEEIERKNEERKKRLIKILGEEEFEELMKEESLENTYINLAYKKDLDSIDFSIEEEEETESLNASYLVDSDNYSLVKNLSERYFNRNIDNFNIKINNSYSYNKYCASTEEFSEDYFKYLTKRFDKIDDDNLFYDFWKDKNKLSLIKFNNNNFYKNYIFKDNEN